MHRNGILAHEAKALPASTLPEREERRQLIIFSLAGVGLGVVGAIAAWALYHLINIFTGLAFYRTFTTKSPLYPPASGLGIWFIIVPVVGGLLVGVMAKYGTDRIRGHGIPEAMEAILKHKSRISPRVAIFKPISAAIAVGTGGPFGAEGPIIQTAGAIGSLIGQTMKLSAKERRILLACGGAAGMVGIFNTPIAAVALALELLLFEFRARSLIPVILASAVAAACRTFLLGSNPMFALGTFPSIGGPLDLLWFVPLGILIGVCSVGLSKALYVVEEFVDRLPIDLLFKPALGALVLGIVAVIQPQVLGMGYVTITNVLHNHFSNADLASLGIGKAVAVVASLGAGTSGGLLAPMLLIGATIGSGYGRAINHVLPGAGINPGICGIVAMSSLFSAAARAPLTSFLFAFELTGDYKAILPLMVGCMVADIVARSLSRESVMTERLARRGLKVEQGYEARLLQLLSVGEVMTKAVISLPAFVTVREAAQAILGESAAHFPIAAGALCLRDTAPEPAAANSHGSAEDASVANSANSAGSVDGGRRISPAIVDALRHWTLPVVTEEGQLSGIVTRGELLAAASDPNLIEKPVEEIVNRRVVVAYTDESLDTALMRMLEGDFQLLPVVDRIDATLLLGVLSRRDVLRAWRLRAEDENRRERTLSVSRWQRSRSLAEAREVDGNAVLVTTDGTSQDDGDTALFEKHVETLSPPDEQ